MSLVTTILVGGPSEEARRLHAARWLAHVEAGRIGPAVPVDPDHAARIAAGVAAAEAALGIGPHGPLRGRIVTRAHA